MKADGGSKRLLSDNVFFDSIIENVPGYVNVKSSFALHLGLGLCPLAARTEGLTDRIKSPIFYLEIGFKGSRVLIPSLSLEPLTP
jgi:hypothetical protein